MRFLLPLVQAARKYIELPHAFSGKRRENTLKQRKSFNSSRMLSCESLFLFSPISPRAASRLQSAHRRLLFPLLFAYTRRLAAIEVFLHALSSCLRVICFYTPGANLLCNVFCSSSGGNMGQMRVLGALGTRYTRALFEKLPHITPAAQKLLQLSDGKFKSSRRFHTFSIFVL
jgi:hypothetical protein